MTVYMSTLTYWSFYFFIFLYVFYAARIGYTFGCHYPSNLNSLGQCICVHQGKISAAAGLEPGTLGLSVNHASNELSCRPIATLYCHVDNKIVTILLLILCRYKSTMETFRSTG